MGRLLLVIAATAACTGANERLQTVPPATQPRTVVTAPPTTPTHADLPFALPEGCATLSSEPGHWRITCGESRDRDARGALAPTLTREGWRQCEFGLASARWAKNAIGIAIAEGSGQPGAGFSVRAGPVPSSCASSASP